MRLTPAARALGAALAVAAYALPPATGALADLSHGVYHAYEALEERHAKAAALGLVHLHDAPAARSHAHAPTESAGQADVHEHGGVAHSHAAGVDLLLAASDELDEEREHVAPTLLELASHLPGRGTALQFSETPQSSAVHDAALDAPDRSLRPPLRPPRA